MNSRSLKILGFVVALIVVLNMVLFAFTIIGAGVFWTVIVLGAVFVYFVLPRLKK